jgi:hypothetical protein
MHLHRQLRGEMMKDIINGEELERLNSELFGPFGPVDESWIGGGMQTISSSVTYGPNGPDGCTDLDWAFGETQAS